jgi:hypothetical protein
MEQQLAALPSDRRAAYRTMVENLVAAARAPSRIVFRERTAMFVYAEDADGRFELIFARDDGGWRALPSR